jgi:hypothetical protein
MDGSQTWKWRELNGSCREGGGRLARVEAKRVQESNVAVRRTNH